MTVHWPLPTTPTDPVVSKFGKHNNVIMVGGGLGIYHDLHETDPSRRYKISGGAPGGCYDDDGDSGCEVGTAGSPDGINHWTDVQVCAGMGWACVGGRVWVGVCGWAIEWLSG